MPTMANLTIGDPEHDPRARRVAAAARDAGVDVRAIGLAAHPTAARARRVPNGPRGLVRLARTALRTGALVRRARLVEADIVHAHDLDTLPAGWLLARRRNARLVYDAHELYTGFDRKPPRLWLAVVRRLE